MKARSSTQTTTKADVEAAAEQRHDGEPGGQRQGELPEVERARRDDETFGRGVGHRREVRTHTLRVMAGPDDELLNRVTWKIPNACSP